MDESSILNKTGFSNYEIVTSWDYPASRSSDVRVIIKDKNTGKLFTARDTDPNEDVFKNISLLNIEVFDYDIIKNEIEKMSARFDIAEEARVFLMERLNRV